MSDEGLQAARDKMEAEGIDATAIEVFAHYYRQLESGETGMIPEDSIEPLDMEALADVEVPWDDQLEALRGTAVIKLNGGLGTSMGLDQAKSLLEVRDGLSFLDVIARQTLHLRRAHDVGLPLLLMNSFRTSEDTMAALEVYDDLATDDLPLEFLQNKEPKLLAEDLTPVEWSEDPEAEWCPPGHGDLYTALYGSGVLAALADAGYERVFVSNSDNLAAVPDGEVAGWFAASGAPFAIEAVRRTPSDRKGGHFARRTADDRIVLRETAQTREEDQDALADLSRHQFMSTNNLWFDIAAMRAKLEETDGVLGLPMIKNDKFTVPGDSSTPEVIQVETAMGAAIELFDGARTIEVSRQRFAPVKTTNDLLVLRSDCYELGEDCQLAQVSGDIPFVDLADDPYKLVDDFAARFPAGPPSLASATSLVVEGDWTFGADVVVRGEVVLGEGTGTLADSRVLTTGRVDAGKHDSGAADEPADGSSPRG